MCSFFCYLSFHNIPRVINSTKEFIILCMKLAHSCSVHSWTSLYWAGYKPKNVTHHLVLKNQIPSQWSDLWHTLKGFSRRWTWVWVNSWSWWWTGKPGVLLFMGLWRAGHDWATELNWKDFSMEIRNEALCTLGKTVRSGLQLVRYFKEKILWVQFLAYFHT